MSRANSLRLILAVVVAVAASLIACALLAAIGIRVFPATSGYPHFRFADYARLVPFGVLGAAVVWSLARAVTAHPCRYFIAAAVLATVALLAPDAWILLHGQPLDAILVLVAMHLAVATITVPALILLAPPGRL